jgi:hypothetical protein
MEPILTPMINMTARKMIKTFSTAALILGTLALGGGAAKADSIGVFNTGVDGTGTPLPYGTVGDPNYNLVTVPGGSTTTTFILTSAGGFPIGPWLGDDSLSAWIGPLNDYIADGPGGDYDYQTTFNLTGLDPTTAILTGQWSTDDSGVDILINGASTGNTAGGFGAWYGFTVNSGFVSGVNTLDFIVDNDSGPTGLRTELTGTASPTPEPASMLLLGVGLAAFGLCKGRRSSGAA